MRPGALVAVLCAAAALVLSFLCLFAGNTRTFMESYDLLNLNTSRIGQGVLNTTSSSSSGLSGLFKNATNGIESDISQDLNNFASSIAKDLGLQDFYSAHLMDYCHGYFTPGPVPNATLDSDHIHRNVTGCSNRTAAFAFDPTAALQNSLNSSGLANTISLSDLHWPEKLEDGIRALRVAWKAMFVLYCIAIGLEFVSLIGSTVGVFGGGRLSALLNSMVATLAFLAIAIASAISTALIIKGTKEINKYGNEIGVSATRGDKFLGITWGATAAMFLAILVWGFECIVGRRRQRYVGKTG